MSLAQRDTSLALSGVNGKHGSAGIISTDGIQPVTEANNDSLAVSAHANNIDAIDLMVLNASGRTGTEVTVKREISASLDLDDLGSPTNLDLRKSDINNNSD